PTTRSCASSCTVRWTAPSRSTCRRGPTPPTWDLPPGPPMVERAAAALQRLGATVIDGIWRVGVMTRFFALVLLASGTSVRRMRLVFREVYFTGVLSLVIIIVSGLF